MIEKVSIVIPAYNAAAVIDRTVDSIKKRDLSQLGIADSE